MQHAMKQDPMTRLFPERQVVSFIHRQDRFVFFSMVNELVGPESVVLDYGAGRGRQAEVGGPHLRRISCFQGRCAKVVGIDVDPVVLDNPVVDEAYVVAPADRLPLPDDSVDVVYSYATFEHVDDPAWVATELGRVVKPGGWICAWTPNKWGYVGIGARLVPNRLHGRVLGFVQPNGRAEHDIFPTRYRMNSLGTVARLFPRERFRDCSFGFNAQPSYNCGSALMARLWLAYMALTPRSMAQTLFIFLQKRQDGGATGA